MFICVLVELWIMCLSYIKEEIIGTSAGVEKSIVRVVRVVHLLLRTRHFFQLTCPWTSEKSYIYVFIFKIESLQTYYYFISEIRIVVKVLQNV